MKRANEVAQWVNHCLNHIQRPELGFQHLLQMAHNHL